MRQLTLFTIFALTLAGCSSVKEVVYGPKTDQVLVQKAEGGEVGAQHALGTKYARASIPKTDKAIYWLCRASTQGHVPSQLELARLYERRTGASVRSAKPGHLSATGSAYYWYTAAAAQGNEQAFEARQALADKMSADEVLDVKRAAARWRKARCVEP